MASVRVNAVDAPDRAKVFTADMGVRLGNCDVAVAATNFHNFANGAEWGAAGTADC